MRKIILVSIAILALCTTVYMVTKASNNNNNETADYTVIKKDGDFEVRDYKPMMLVSTTMKGSELRNNSAFQRLFQYISGSNENEQKIAMTAPVFSKNDEKTYTMSFLVPKDVAEKGAPAPSDKNVKIEEMEGGKFAAFRYSGYSTSETIKEGEKKLAEWIKKHNLKTKGEMISAGYDAPYVPADRRRNEVMIRLAK